MNTSLLNKLGVLLVIVLLCSCEKFQVADATENTKTGFLNHIFSNSEASYPSTLKTEDYIKFCDDPATGLKKEKEIGDFIFSAFYQPKNYLALKEFKSEVSLSKKDIESKVAEYGDLTYFSFRIQNLKDQADLLKTDLENEAHYFSRLEYLSFKMQQDLKLVNGKDTLDCVIYHYERVYNLAPYATFVVAFPKTDNKQDIKFWYHDRLFNTGIIILNFDKKLLDNLPTPDL